MSKYSNHITAGRVKLHEVPICVTLSKYSHNVTQAEIFSASCTQQNCLVTCRLVEYYRSLGRPQYMQVFRVGKLRMEILWMFWMVVNNSVVFGV
jgi:hypothetical protein